MKRIIAMLCMLCAVLMACAPQQSGQQAATETIVTSQAADAETQVDSSAQKLESFFQDIPENDLATVLQIREGDIQIPPMTERPVSLPATPTQGVGLNFENADIHDVTKIVSEITGKSFIVDEDVEGTVTIYSERSLSPTQVFELFKSVLELNGLAITRVGDFYKIVRSEKAQRRYLTVDSNKTSITDELVTQVVKLRYVTGNAVKSALQSLTDSDITIYPDENGKTLIITDLASNVQKLLEIIDVMDISQYANRYVEIFLIEHAELEDLVQDLNQILSIPGASGTLEDMAIEPEPAVEEEVPLEQPGVSEQITLTPVVPPGTETVLHAIPRLNALMVSSNNPDVLTLVGRWIAILDQPSQRIVEDDIAPTGRGNYVYHVNYSEAAALAEMLSSVYAGIAEEAPELQEEQPEAPSGEQDTAPVFIPDEINNALIIRASSAQYAEILSLLEDLDRRPPQVLIDVIIAEVTLSDNDVFGVQGMLQGQDQLTLGGETNVFNSTAETTFPGITGGDGFNYMLAAPGRFLLQLRALAAEGRVKVLSDPHILVRDNFEANINIGDSIPITTVTGTGDTAEQNVEYRDTGITLRVKPKINTEGDVVMSITQEVSTPGTRQAGDAAPPINQTTAQTDLITQDGQPLVIGGLIKSEGITSTQGIPLLKDLPLLGKLFRFSETQNTRKELVLLVIPRIVRTPEQGWNLTDDVLKKRVKQLEQLFNREETDADKVKQFLRRQFVPTE